MHEIQSETFEGAIAQPPLRERAEIRTDRGVVIRSIDLTGLRDHDRRSATPRLERDVVSAPFGVLVRGCRWRCGPVTLRHDNATCVAEGGDRGDIHDPRGPGRACGVEDATSARHIRLLHRTAALRGDTDLVDRRPVHERVGSMKIGNCRRRMDDIAADELAPERGERGGA